ncbi:MAG TPA: glucose-1-phosphate adenylyltransferase family protein [Roseiflexaceae bacterium]|nr:glucose-1-phosphate adenylyltransferase family protein [Roseiflexaceae bacterium]
MARTKILTLVMAGGAGGRMDLLTDVRAKPALPFAGVYRLIDIPLSNCVHSGLSDIWIVEQFQPQTLNDHLANGRPWDLDRTYGGLRLLPPFTGTSESGWHRGNADALYRNRRFIREFAPDLLLVLSADHLYKLDYWRAIDAHLSADADVTMVTAQVPREEVGRFGNVRVDGQGRVTEFVYKPDEPLSETVTTEVFVYRCNRLMDLIDELAADGAADSEEGLKDYGHDLLPALVREGRAYALPLDGYWRDVGTIDSYWQAHMDLLAPEPPLDLDDPHWPILTYGTQRVPARILDTARIDQSLIAPGCRVAGLVERSVLGPGVVVEPGAHVREAVIFGGTTVEAGARVERAIVDSGVRIGARAQVGGQDNDRPLDQQIVLVGQRALVEANAQIKPGARIKPAEQD